MTPFALNKLTSDGTRAKEITVIMPIYLQTNIRRGSGIMIDHNTLVEPLESNYAETTRAILNEMAVVSRINETKTNGHKICGLNKKTFLNAMIVVKNVERVLDSQDLKEQEIMERLRLLEISEEEHRKEKAALEPEMIRLEQENDRLRAQLLERDLAL